MVWQDQLTRLAIGIPDDEPLLLLLQRGGAGKCMTWDASACPGCGGVVENPRSPYCGELCRERAGFVRQCRSIIGSASPLAEDRRQMLNQVLWSLLGGGYPERVREIPDASVRKVLDRDGVACHACGQPAERVEHLRTACNRPINLAAVCEQCRRTRDYGDQTFLARPEVIASLAELAARVTASEPLRRCDDPAGWDWRAFLKERARV